MSQALMNDLTDAAHDYTSLAVQTSLNPFASDHVPFINASLPALLTIEGADPPTTTSTPRTTRSTRSTTGWHRKS